MTISDVYNIWSVSGLPLAFIRHCERGLHLLNKLETIKILRLSGSLLRAILFTDNLIQRYKLKNT